MQKVIRAFYHLFSGFLASKQYHLIRSLVYLYRPKRLPLKRLDYIRISCLELAAQEIYAKNIPGSVAELGVYQGDFAQDINAVFPDKSFYLFDTFTGFDRRDVAPEVNRRFSRANQDFSNTSVAAVLAKMPYPAQCIVKQGFFPETAADIQEKFCFVSIDTDLYEPIFAGLNYFYPRLCPGGYIFVHDFNNQEYPGAAEAVRAFCREFNCSYVPVADIGGTAIISK